MQKDFLGFKLLLLASVLTSTKNNNMDAIYLIKKWKFLLVIFISMFGLSSKLDAQMMGTYTIGGGGSDFTTLNDAVTALSQAGVGGAVTFNVAPGTYTEQLTIGIIPGVSSTNTVTFQSSTLESTDVTISYGASSTTDNWVVRFDGADYMVFKQMSFASSTSSYYGRVLEFLNGADNNTISNCEIRSVQTSNIYACPVYSYAYGGTPSSHNIFSYNRILNGYYSVYWNGSSVTSMGLSNVFVGNEMLDWYYYGVYLRFQDAVQVCSNIIQNGSNSGYVYGMYMYYCDNDIVVTKNKINLTGSGYNYGLRLYRCDGTSGNPGLIANNFFAISSTSTNNHYAVYLSYSNWQNVIYNSVNIANGASSYGWYTWSGGNLSYMNNSIVNMGGGYTFYVNTPTAITYSDYNNLYTSGATLAYWGGAASGLTNLQLLSSKDLNSVSVNPDYTSNSDLHLLTTALEGLANPTSLCLADIDNQLRSTTTPDIGADEYMNPDTDGDGIDDIVDNCPTISNTDQADDDCDGVGDVCDVCPNGDDMIDNNNDGFPDCAQLLNYSDYYNSWQCGTNKIYICHVPPGNLFNPQTICISMNALSAHIGHGDPVGPCIACGQNPKSIGVNETHANDQQVLDIEMFPNPANSNVSIYLHGLEGKASLTIVDQLGKLVWKEELPEGQSKTSVKLDDTNFKNGVYYVTLISNGQVMNKMLIITE
ncbi:T9SS type A sorting domain-containing protein [candidate division KSB1 bacterium]